MTDLHRLQHAVYRRLRAGSPYATDADVMGAIETALHALEVLGLEQDREAVELARLVAERQLLLRLGVEREDARLDPIRRTGRRRMAEDATQRGN